MMLAYCNSPYIFPGVIIPCADILTVAQPVLIFALIDYLFYCIVFLKFVYYYPIVYYHPNKYHKVIKKFRRKIVYCGFPMEFKYSEVFPKN